MYCFDEGECEVCDPSLALIGGGDTHPSPSIAPASKELCPRDDECWHNTIPLGVDPTCAACHDDARTLFYICTASNLCGCQNELCRACLDEHKAMAQTRIRRAMKRATRF
jgi:hypothetical protein